jgi:transposase
MAKMTEHTIGVDISKSHLDVFRLENGAARRFENTAAGFRALVKWLGEAPVARIVFEQREPITRRSRRRLPTGFPWSR